MAGAISAVALAISVGAADAKGSRPASAAISLSLDPKSDTGAPGDGVTRDATPTLSGTAPAKAKVVLKDGARIVATVTAKANGTWKKTTAKLSEGGHVLIAMVSGVGGSAPLALVVDTRIPIVPAISLSPPFAIASNGAVVTADTTPTFTGSTEPGAFVTVRDGSRVVGTATAAGNGAWALTAGPLADGTFRFSAKAMDRAGNASGSSRSIAVVVNGLAAAAPTIALAAGSDTGVSAVDRITRDATPTVSGTAPPKARVEILGETRVAATVTASPSGAWKKTLPTLADGPRALSARAGGQSSPAIGITIDTAKPATPSIALVGGAEVGTPTLAGSTSPAAIVTVRNGSIPVGTVTANDAGRWSLTTPSLAEGTHRFSARAADLAGNESGTSPSLGVKIEPEGPRPVTIDLAAASDTSRSDDDVTRDATPAIVGTAKPGAEVVLKDFGTPIGKATAADTGDWSITTSALAAGEHRLLASANGRSSDPLILAVEVVPPVVDLATAAVGESARIDAGVGGWGESNRTVAPAGDVNDDGYPDILLGTPEGGGDAYLVFGRAGGLPPVTDLHDLGVHGVRLAELGDERFEVGHGVAGIGDVNHDGYDDVAIGRRYPARVYVVFGRPSFPAAIDLRLLDGSNGGAFLDATGGFDTNGVASISAAGDVNADGIDDFVIGSPDVTDGAGRAAMATIVLGGAPFASGRLLGVPSAGVSVFVCTGPDDSNGFSVGGGRDIDDDGVDDVVVGAPSASANSGGSGAVYVIYGKAGGLPQIIRAADLDGSNGSIITGGELSRYGASVALVGDVDGDGLGDILAAAPNELGAYLVYGRAGGFGAATTVSDVEMLRIRADDMDMWSVGSAGDADGDGLTDVLFGMESGENGRGLTQLLFGRDIRRTGTLDLADAADGEIGFAIVGAADDLAGSSVGTAGDTNGDGRADLLIRASGRTTFYQSEFGPNPLSGSAYVVPAP